MMFYEEVEYSIVICWIIAILQVFIAIVLLIVLPIINRILEARRERKNKEKKAIEEEEETNRDALMQSSAGWRSTIIRAIDNTYDLDDASTNADDSSVSSPTTKICPLSPIFKTERSQRNFNKSNFDSMIEYPSDYNSEYITLEQRTGGLTHQKVMLDILSRPKSLEMLRLAFGYAFLTSGISSMISILESYAPYMQTKCSSNINNTNDCDNDEDNNSITYTIKEWQCHDNNNEDGSLYFYGGLMAFYMNGSTWMNDTASALNLTIILFSFLPLFLLLASLSFLVERWRFFLQTCHSIQGRIQDIGLICGSLPNLKYNNNDERVIGSSISSIDDHKSSNNNQGEKCLDNNDDDDDEMQQQQKIILQQAQERLYTIYRYLNVVHILCMKSFSPNLSTINEDYNILGSSHLNLLTPKEINLIALAENKGRDAMLGMLNHAIDALLGEDYVRNRGDAYVVSVGTILKEHVCNFRGLCADIHDLFVRDNPNEYTAAISTFIYFYKILIVLMSPVYLMAENSIPVFCLQPGVFLGVFFTFLSLTFPSVLFRSLKNPFNPKCGIIVENLIASSELCIFQTLRLLWWEEDDDYYNNKHNNNSSDSDSDSTSRSYNDPNNLESSICRSKQEEFQQSIKARVRNRFRETIPRGEFGDL